ncbi:MAG: site-specific integrase, partial [candidate division NC10 bacterium]
RYVGRLGRNINRTAAREIASVKRAAILKGEAGIGEKRKDLPFEKAAAKFLEWAEANKKPRTVRSYRQCVGQLLRSFGGKRPMREIHAFLIEKHKRERIAGGARVAANREVTVLKALFNRCIEWGLFAGENPARKVKLLKEPRGRLRYLDVDEEIRLLQAASEPLRTIIMVGLHAGLRINAEALTLRWADVDLKRSLLTVQAAYAKSGQTRTVEINSGLREALTRLRDGASPERPVFRRKDGKPLSSIRTIFEKACREAKLIGVTPHTLRHTFASKLMMAGVDMRTIQELGGWSDLKMVERYSHLSPSHKAEAVEKIASHSTTLFTTPQGEAKESQGQVIELTALGR